MRVGESHLHFSPPVRSSDAPRCLHSSAFDSVRAPAPASSPLPLPRFPSAPAVPPSPGKDTPTGRLPAATRAHADARTPLPAAACVDQPKVGLGLKRPLDCTLILSAATNLDVVLEYLAAVLTEANNGDRTRGIATLWCHPRRGKPQHRLPLGHTRCCSPVLPTQLTVEATRHACRLLRRGKSHRHPGWAIRVAAHRCCPHS